MSKSRRYPIPATVIRIGIRIAVPCIILREIGLHFTQLIGAESKGKIQLIRIARGHYQIR